jgi:hypothetical protein
MPVVYFLTFPRRACLDAGLGKVVVPYDEPEDERDGARPAKNDQPGLGMSPRPDRTETSSASPKPSPRPN